MYTSINKDTLNYLGEFRDKKIEIEFFCKDMQRAILYIRPIIIVLGILNTLFLIPDYFFVASPISFKYIVVSRMVFLLLVIILSVFTKTVKDYRMFAYWTTIVEVLCSLLFLFNFFQYENPDFFIQALGVIVILFSVFMVPNRWVNMIIVSLLISIGFLSMSLYYIKDIKMSDFLTGAIYISIIMILCCIPSFRNHYYKRVHYINSEALERMAVTDPLTGIYNRAKLDDELKIWTSYSQKYNSPLSLAILDFDDFKSVNDTYGHLTGDIVIKESVNCIKNNVRSIDIFARWGGEEFVILLPNTDLGHAVVIIEKLRDIVEACPHEIDWHVTCSFGIAQFDSDIESMLRKADQNLYLAKSAGKNSVKS